MMTHRDGLAPDLRAMTPPGESIAWRNDEATRTPGLGARRIAFIGLPLLGVGWLWLSPGEAGSFTWAATGILALVVGIQVIAAGERAFKYAIVVAADRVLWRLCRSGAPIDWIPRSEIVGATIYEASGTVLLHGKAGQQQRFTGIADSRSMALSLGVRVEVWIDRGDPSHGGRLTRWLIAAAVGMASTLTSVFYDIFLGRPPTLRAIAVTLAVLAAAVLLYVGGHWLQARRMMDDQRCETACHLLDPLWRGGDPYTGGGIPWWEVPAVIFKLWLARHIYGGPHDCRTGLEPLVYEPGSVVPEPRRESA